MSHYYNPNWEREAMTQAHGWNPFWNPMSPYADIGGGISSVLGMLSQKKQTEEQQRLAQEQQMWERGIKDRQVTAQEKAAEPTPAKPSDLDSWMAYGNSIGFGGYQPHEWALLYKRDLPETPEQIGEKEKARARGQIAGGKVPRSEQELDKDYLSDVEKINTTINAQVATARQKRIEAIQEILSNSYMFKPEEVQANVEAINTEYETYIESLENTRKTQVEALAGIYPELKKARVVRPEGRGEPTATPTPGKGRAVAGAKKRSELPAGADVRVAPDGRKFAEIDGKIYAVID